MRCGVSPLEFLRASSLERALLWKLGERAEHENWGPLLSLDINLRGR